MSSRMYLHVDLDAFFASVEVLDNPELKGKPLIVGGLPGERRSVVSTCSYEARKYGVHSAMPINRAYELCPQAVFVHGRMERYHEKSQEVMSVFRDFSPDVMQMSIDEAFIDITGTELLFGSPDTLARTLKKEVLEKTGLTVSVGIATNRYVAKIASGLKKPDGLCYVPAGEEEKFMLSLPLDKLWGIGTKSRERLNACGIYTIPEIHAISETALKELFGEASGTFLYRSVRGMDVEHFGDETKSRSMSAERTFCFDLTDIYAIETELLHLSYDVMFRVLKAKVNSKTVCLKIRYEDFTTVTVTESSTRIVSSIEDLFERACRLFHKKAERGRGIRLLGLGLQNIADGLESEQGELFDFGEKKQRSVETAVLKLHQKDPCNKLKKARQFITSAIAILFISGAAGHVAAPLHAETSSSLMNDNVVLEVEGSWEAAFSESGTAYFGGAAPVLSLQTPVLTQKADLSLWFLCNDHWYFDASVATDSDQNVIAAGYQGDGLVQEVRIGTDIGTESSSPGMKIKLQGDNWDAGAYLHLDSVQTFSKTWKGSSEQITADIPVSSYKSGFLFSVIDADTAAHITAVYVEDKAGSWLDTNGRRYKKLPRDTYLLLPAKSLLYLESPVQGAVIVETSDKSTLETRLPAFLKATADWFGDRGAESTFTMMGISCSNESEGPSSAETAPLFTTLSNGSGTGVDGLYLSKPGFFSPFQVASLYDVTSDQESVLSVDAKTLCADYTSSILLNESSSLIQLHTTENGSVDYAEPSVRFPAGKKYPWIYLASSGVTDDIIPTITSTSSEYAETINIGSQAVENSVQVLKNGSPVSCMYDRDSGTVTIPGGVSQSDTITVIWNEYSSENSNMTLSAGFDFNAALTQNFLLSGNAASTLFVDPAARNLSSSASEEPYADAALKGQWERTFGNITLSLSNILSTKALFASDSDKARLLTFSGTGNVSAWITDGARQTDGIPTLSKRTKDSASIVVPELDEALADSCTVVSARNRSSAGYTLTLTGALHQNSGLSPHWFSVDVPLSSSAASLVSAHEFALSLTNLETASTSYDVYLQLGADLSSNAAQEGNHVSTWLISSSDAAAIPASDVLSSFRLTETGKQTVRVTLTDSDRMKLEKSHDMRLIFVNKDDNADADVNVTVSLGTAAISGVSFNVRTENASGTSVMLPVSIREQQFPEAYPERGLFPASSGTPYAALISWNTDDAVSGSRIKAEQVFSAVSLARWKKADILFFVPETSAATGVTVNLLSLTDDGFETVESISISEADMAAHKGDWYTLSKELSSHATVSKVQIVLDAVPQHDSGTASLYFGGIFLSEPVSSLTVSDEASAVFNWETDDYSANITFNADETLSYLSSVNDAETRSANASVAFSAPFLDLTGNGAFNMASPSVTDFGYTIATKQGLILDYISFRQNYQYTDKTDSYSFKNEAAFSLEPVSVPVTINALLETDRKGDKASGKASINTELLFKKSQTAASLSVIQTDAPYSSFNYMGTENARKKTENAALTETLSFAEGAFTPSLGIAFNSASDKDHAERTGTFNQKLVLPVSMKSGTLSFEYNRETSSEYQPSFTTITYMDDISAYVDAFTVHLNSLTIVPLYDLFSSDIQAVLRKQLADSEHTSGSTYSSAGTISWNRPLRADLLDMIIPQNASVTASRTLSQAGLNTLDKRTTTFFTSFTAFNCFGASSTHPLLAWYDQDEFQYSAKLSFDGSFKTDLTWYNTLYFENDAACTTFYSGTIVPSEQYAHTVQFSWKRSGQLFDKDTERVTSGSFSVAGGKTALRQAMTIGLTHKATVAVNDIFSVNGTASISAQCSDRTKLTGTLSIGGKMQF